MSFRSFLSRRRGMVGFVAGVASSALVLGATAAIAAIPSTTTASYTACVNKSTGAVRIIDAQAGKKCSTSERTVSWGKGYRYRGTWTGTTAYAAQDVVLLDGTSYVAKIASTGKTPPNATYWGVLAAKGATGPAGPAGPAGPGYADRRATGTPPTSSIYFGANLISAVSNGATQCTLRFENFSPVTIDLLLESAGAASQVQVPANDTPTIVAASGTVKFVRFRAKQGPVAYTGEVWYFPASSTTCTIDGHVVTGSYAP